MFASTRREIALRCGKCRTKLADGEILMLATTLATEPPSHLLVKEGNEEDAYQALDKVENAGAEKSSQNRCPYTLHCRVCSMVVGKVTRLAAREFICFKFENVFIMYNGEKIEAKKVSKVRERLQQCGIKVVNISNTVTSQHPTLQSSSRPQASLPMVYCDTRELTHTSREIDVLTRENPRDYQRELFLSTMRRNTLVYLPTGSGKTLIAAMVLSCMRELNPGKLMVFLVDRIPLVFQQSNYIKKQLPGLKVGSLAGEMEPEQLQSVHKKLAERKIDVLVLTHQIFLNALAAQTNQIIRISDISVLVFDEAHHCQGNHPYNKIMSQFYHNNPKSLKPLVLGLSASPAGELSMERTLSKLKELLDNLECNISTPVVSEDLIAHVNYPDTSYEVACASNDYLKLVIQEHIQHLKTKFIDNAQESHRFELQEIPVFSPNFRGALRRLIDDCHGNEKRIKPLIVGEHIMQMLGVVDLSEVLGCKHAVECLQECVKRVSSPTTPKDGALKRIVDADATFHGVKIASSILNHGSSMSERYNILQRHVRDFVNRSLSDETCRGIIFVSMRKTAYKLCEQIRSIPMVREALNPEAFVGHGQGSYDGMTWRDDQELLLKRFKSGVTKLLISTNVLEEGLDVPICNLVVRFEGAATLRALVQTRGRASRRHDSKFVVICDENEKQGALDVINKERNMKIAIKDLVENQRLKSQAEEFGCELRKPSFLSPFSQESKKEIHAQSCRPLVSISVQNFEELTYRVISFLQSNFDVMSMKPTQSASVAETGQKRMTFELQPREDVKNKEFKSKEQFLYHVVEMWCSELTNPDEEPIPVWLQVSLPRKRQGKKEADHQLPAISLFLGTLVTRCHFLREWPPEARFEQVQIHFDHSFRILRVSFRLLTLLYKLELRYDELEEFIIVDNDVSSGAKRIFLTAKHPPRIFKDGEPHELPLNDNLLQSDDEDSLLESSDSESTDSFSSDEEYADEARNVRDRVQSSASSSERTWDRVSHVGDGEEAWGQCLTYCFALSPGDSYDFMSLITVIQNRFHKKVIFCRVKETSEMVPFVDSTTNLPSDVKYAAQSVISMYPAMRRRLSGNFGMLLQRNPPDVISALIQLRKSLEQDRFCEPEETLNSLLGQGNPPTSGTLARLVPSHCALIKRAVITPTRLLLFPPEVMVKNRVLRQYDKEKFLCVSIRDEDLSKLSAAGGSLDLLLHDINLRLNKGLAVAGQHFHFLGSSNSQLRNHSCWFVEAELQPDYIRKWMGDLAQIR